MNDNLRIAVIGLGYVGLPLYMAFKSKFETIGFDKNSNRITELCAGFDNTNEFSDHDLKNLSITDKIENISGCNFYIVAVPTPVDQYNQPNFSALIEATKAVGEIIKDGDIVVFESTVYPGATKEICVPILEMASKLKLNQGFYVGYSPERINPGDKTHTLNNIIKVVSGSDKQSTDTISEVYSKIISAGTYKTNTIEEAEAAKVIENIQRDVNIALINELAIIFDKLNINVWNVLDAANTKWNFLNFKPGMVGGHCIGVDPYYLAAKAKSVGCHPEIILSGRRINDNMSRFISEKFIREWRKNSKLLFDGKVLLLGVTFKENCSDIRNTKIIDLYHTLTEYSIDVDLYDPIASSLEVKNEYGIDLIRNVDFGEYNAVIFCVAHQQFSQPPFSEIKKKFGDKIFVFDAKNILPVSSRDLTL